MKPIKTCRVLKEEGFEGKYGFYEAIDYTPARLPRKQKRAVIQSFMAHHQGMSFLSLSYLLLNRPMQQRFEAEVQLKSTLLLLQERIPRMYHFLFTQRTCRRYQYYFGKRPVDDG